MACVFGYDVERLSCDSGLIFLSARPQVETILRTIFLPRPAQLEHGQCPKGLAAGWRCSDFASFLAGTWTQHWPEECSCYREDVANERAFPWYRLGSMVFVLNCFCFQILVQNLTGPKFGIKELKLFLFLTYSPTSEETLGEGVRKYNTFMVTPWQQKPHFFLDNAP